MTAAAYTSAAAIKSHANISDANSDTILGAIATAVNEYIEGETGAPIADGGTAARTFDGNGSKCLHIRQGVQDLALVEYANSSSDAQDGTYTTVAAGQYVLRARVADRPTGWPGFRVYLIDGSTPATFPVGYDTVRVTPTSGWGWAAIPPDLSQVATIAGLRMFQSSQSGEGLQIGTTEIGAAIIRFLPEPEYRAIIERYAAVVSPAWSG